MHEDTFLYNRAQSPADQQTRELLAREIDNTLPEADNKVCHAHPVWFLERPVLCVSRPQSAGQVQGCGSALRVGRSG